MSLPSIIKPVICLPNAEHHCLNEYQHPAHNHPASGEIIVLLSQLLPPLRLLVARRLRWRTSFHLPRDMGSQNASMGPLQISLDVIERFEQNRTVSSCFKPCVPRAVRDIRVV